MNLEEMGIDRTSCRLCKGCIRDNDFVLLRGFYITEEDRDLFLVHTKCNQFEHLVKWLNGESNENLDK